MFTRQLRVALRHLRNADVQVNQRIVPNMGMNILYFRQIVNATNWLMISFCGSSSHHHHHHIVHLQNLTGGHFMLRQTIKELK